MIPLHGILAHDTDSREQVAETINQAGGTAKVIDIDVTDAANVQAMVSETVETFGSVDGLLHCAADVPFVNNRDARLTELDDEVWDRMLRLFLTGTFYVCKHVGHQMIKQGSGSIVLCATTDALIGVAGLDAYTAAKGGVVALTRSFAAGMAPDGVRVNTICPSFVSSEPQREWLDNATSQATVDSLHLLPIAIPEQIAPLGVYLLSDESAIVTGGIHAIDSGYMAFKARLDVMGAMRV
jgi:NAD(P)-dependent dehydrogenase (short-subunit alcohol dehydrogenase family)